MSVVASIAACPICSGSLTPHSTEHGLVRVCETCRAFGANLAVVRKVAPRRKPADKCAVAASSRASPASSLLFRNETSLPHVRRARGWRRARAQLSVRGHRRTLPALGHPRHVVTHHVLRIDLRGARCQARHRASLADVFRVLNGLEATGVIERYAVGGAHEHKLQALLSKYGAVMSPGPNRARPAAELLENQRQAKARWRREMAARPLREKIALLLEMQRRLYPILQQRRTLQWWERPWDIEP